MPACDLDGPAGSGIVRPRTATLLCLILGFLAGTTCAGAADSEPSPQVWLNPGFLSWHFQRDQDLRGNNWGVGAEVVFTPDHAAIAGNFINSDGDRSHYGAYLWRPLHWRPYGVDVSAGVALGAFDGYQSVNNGGWFVAPLPLLAVEGRRLGANFTIVPTINDKVHGAVVLQLKLRVW